MTPFNSLIRNYSTYRCFEPRMLSWTAWIDLYSQCDSFTCWCAGDILRVETCFLIWMNERTAVGLFRRNMDNELSNADHHTFRKTYSNCLVYSFFPISDREISQDGRSEAGVFAVNLYCPNNDFSRQINNAFYNIPSEANTCVWVQIAFDFWHMCFFL